MSKTKKTRIDKDNYPTPIPVVEALLDKITFRPKDRFLEPCRGVGRNIYNRVKLPNEQKSWAELDEGVDYLTTKFSTKDVIITNPPFSLTVEFLEKAVSEMEHDGTLVFLQRVNFLGAKCRVDFWERVGFPNKTPIIIPRPRFVNGGSDCCEYMWMIWDYGNRFKSMPEGISHIISK